MLFRSEEVHPVRFRTGPADLRPDPGAARGTMRSGGGGQGKKVPREIRVGEEE